MWKIKNAKRGLFYKKIPNAEKKKILESEKYQ
jgi:hypothetical protein